MPGKSYVVNVPEVIRRNRQLLEAFAKAVNGEVFRAAVETTNLARQKVPVDTGYLRANIREELVSNYQAVVSTGDADYAAAVEFGTSPHWPNIEALKRWAYHKLGDEKLAYPVARRIAMAGTEERPYLRPAFEEVAPKLKATLEALARRISGK